MHANKLEVITNTGAKLNYSDCNVTYLYDGTILSIDHECNGKDIINYYIPSLLMWRIIDKGEDNMQQLLYQSASEKVDSGNSPLIVDEYNAYKVSTLKQFIEAISNILNDHRAKNGIYDLDPTTIAIVVGREKYFINHMCCDFIGYLYDIENDPSKSYIGVILSSDIDGTLTSDFIFNGEVSTFDGELAIKYKIDISRREYYGHTLYIHNTIYAAHISDHIDSFIYCHIE